MKGWGVYRVTGKKKVINNIKDTSMRINNAMQSALTDGAELIRDRSIESLQNLAKEPGLSVQGGKITDKKSWVIEPMTDTEIVLKCLSEHAAIVEFGGMGRSILATDYGWKGFPIGRQQGKEPPTIRSKVKLQRGYNYFRSTINSEYARLSALNRIKRNLWKAARGTGMAKEMDISKL